jgi:hypothetical protein
MAKVWVYRYEVFDAEARSWSPAPHFATREHIDAHKGAVILNSKLEIDSSALSAEGTYVSPHKPWRR